MKTKHLVPLLGMLALAGLLAAVAPASGAKRASLVIQHQTKGCHAWSLNHGAFRASQTVAITRGGSIVVTNNDVMPHKLVKTSGPAVVYKRLQQGTVGLKGTYAPAMLPRMGSASSIAFAKKGVYHFMTKAGEDYMPGVKTTGEDNVLRLTVRVS